MSIPAEVVRVTKHKRPKHQLYQPGFNESNGCWLEGSWLTVTEADFNIRQVEHLAMYGDIHAQMKTQHYRDSGVPPEKMTKAQRQAWEHFSGQGMPYLRGENGVGPAHIELAAGKIRLDSMTWLRKSGAKVLQWVTMPDGTLVNQQETWGIPDDLVESGHPYQPADPWEEIVAQNRASEDEMFEAFLEGPYGDFGALMAFQSLISLEEGLIRDEWGRSKGQADKYFDPAREIPRYVTARSRLRAKLGEHFDAHYDVQRTSHNECARANLDNSQGSFFCFVLPVFRDDGSHDPWGAHDVPWGVQDGE